MIVRRVHVCAGANQQVRGLDIVPMGRPMQRRHTIALRGIHVSALLQEGTHGPCVLSLDCFYEPDVGVGGSGNTACRQEPEEPRRTTVGEAETHSVLLE